MRRCGIFVFYNEHGIVEPYVDYLLQEVLKILDKLIIVINGPIYSYEKDKLSNYSKLIFQRKNIGYDGGAYKDIFTRHQVEEWNEYDEMLLMNDTFYGPFFDWNEIFGLMEDRKCDFWGLSSHPGGSENLFNGEIISPHIQSYFIVLKRKLFTHFSFMKFWERLQYPKSYKEAVKKFEIYFSEYFSSYGFAYESWIEVKVSLYEKYRTINFNDIKMLIVKFRFPIFKKKLYLLQNYISLKELFLYLYDYVNYPIELIELDLVKRCLEGKVNPYNPYKILKFCKQYEEIYLFGMGEYAKNIEQFLKDFSIQIKGYIVSKSNRKRDNVYEINDFQIKTNQGIIVSLNQKHFKEVDNVIKKKIPLQHIIFPIYD